MSVRQALATVLGSFLLACAGHANPIAGFTQTTLQTSLTDAQLVNPWGMASSATSPFWISDNGSGLATLYNTPGVKQGLVVSMPFGATQVTGQVFNGTSSFNQDVFLFATQDGTINGWRGALGTTAEVLFSVPSANYTGLAGSNAKNNLYAANFATGAVDVFGAFGLIGSYYDPNMPAGYAPFNIQNLNGTIYVTYAMQGSGGSNVPGAGNGFVDIFNPDTFALTRLTSQGALNSPWGLAIAPSGFGTLGGDLLVGNFGDGTINVFDTSTGSLIGTLADAVSDPLVNDGLWALDFGNGANGGLASSLYITAGPHGQTGGLLARIDATQIPEPSSLMLMAAGLSILVWRRRDSGNTKIAIS